ncbi:MAG: restriction endonuclease [Melioribacteraceae bacterium]|nr:restriction endonuclease [Melioribacteraceae bacterium]
MNPKEFEELVCEHFRNKGYNVEATSYCNDYGVDLFAYKGNEKIAVQAKMYGGGSRKINRQMVMELHGAKDYFDCTKAVIATDGALLPDAIEVARKLKIDIINIDFSAILTPHETKLDDKTFESIWEQYIIPLQGKTLIRSNGETNKILKIDWSEVKRITSNGNEGKIKIEIFRLAINKLLEEGSITRDYINQNYVSRASSGIILILSQVPFFQLTSKPTGLKYIK